MFPHCMPPPGIRVDDWRAVQALPPADHPRVASLREEFRLRAPELAKTLETLATVFQFQDLTGRLASAKPVEVHVYRR